MKKLCIILFTLIIIILTAMGIGNGAQSQTATANADYLRIHIRANSNDAQDQEVKYLVRDEVVKNITPWVAECVDKTSAVQVMSAHLTDIETLAERVLSQYGYTYGARAQIRTEQFPTRVYEEYTLDGGVYDALILELGSGAGDNWWCCIYPPFCFTRSQNIVYRSKILQTITDWLDRADHADHADRA